MPVVQIICYRVLFSQQYVTIISVQSVLRSTNYLLHNTYFCLVSSINYMVLTSSAYLCQKYKLSVFSEVQIICCIVMFFQQYKLSVKQCCFFSSTNYLLHSAVFQQYKLSVTQCCSVSNLPFTQCIFCLVSNTNLKHIQSVIPPLKGEILLSQPGKVFIPLLL